LRIFSLAPTKLQSNHRNAQQEIIFHHPANGSDRVGTPLAELLGKFDVPMSAQECSV